MSEDMVALVKKFLTENTFNSNDTDSAFVNQMKRGMHAKKVIDAHRTNQDYYKSKDVHTDLLEHYENVDWYERNADYDLDPYIERI